MQLKVKTVHAGIVQFAQALGHPDSALPETTTHSDGATDSFGLSPNVNLIELAATGSDLHELADNGLGTLRATLLSGIPPSDCEKATVVVTSERTRSLICLGTTHLLYYVDRVDFLMLCKVVL